MKEHDMAKAQLAQAVEYVSNGKAKMAFVIGTRKSVEKGTSIQRPDKGAVNIFVISPQGQSYARFNVPVGDESGAVKFVRVPEAETSVEPPF
jgi:hypothetical protein